MQNFAGNNFLVGANFQKRQKRAEKPGLLILAFEFARDLRRYRSHARVHTACARACSQRARTHAHNQKRESEGDSEEEYNFSPFEFARITRRYCSRARVHIVQIACARARALKTESKGGKESES